MRLLFAIGLMFSAVMRVCAEPVLYPALNGNPDARRLVIYSALDLELAEPIVRRFQAVNPDVAVLHEEMLTGEIYDRIVRETDSGGETADFAFSSAMDLQVKLANDGYAQPSDLPASKRWPRWANWRNTAYALTFEPAVFVYHRPSFRDRPPPATRRQFIDYLEAEGERVFGRIATYDIAESGVGFMFLTRDQEQYGDIWSVVRAMGRAGVRLHSTSSAILEQIGDGRVLLGYNILGSYAADWAAKDPDIGIVLPEDYTVVMSRIALVPSAARSPDLGRRYLEFFMSAEGQALMARQLHIAAINPDVSGENTADTMLATLGAQLRPVPVSPGLMVYLDQLKRRRTIERWNRALRGQ